MKVKVFVTHGATCKVSFGIKIVWAIRWAMKCSSVCTLEPEKIMKTKCAQYYGTPCNWNFIEQEVVNQDKLVAELTKWGPAYQVSLDMKINSFPQSEWAEVLRVTSTYGDAGSVGDRIPAIFANKGGFIHICTQVGTNANWCKNFNISQGRWYMLELGQNKENTKVICINSRLFKYALHPFSISMR